MPPHSGLPSVHPLPEGTDPHSLADLAAPVHVGHWWRSLVPSQCPIDEGCSFHSVPGTEWHTLLSWSGHLVSNTQIWFCICCLEMLQVKTEQGKGEGQEGHCFASVLCRGTAALRGHCEPWELLWDTFSSPEQMLLESSNQSHYVNRMYRKTQSAHFKF